MCHARPLVLCCTCVFIVVASVSAHAQDSTSVITGDRVRVTVQTSPREEGVVAAITRDSLTFSTRDGSRRTLARADIELLEVARGTETRERSFGLGGAVIGAVIGAVRGAQAIERQHSRPSGFPQMGSAGAGGFAGGLLGALAGGLVGDVFGRQFTTTRWQRVSR